MKTPWSKSYSALNNPATSSARDEKQVISLLRRLFNGGPMRRLPKKRDDADVLLAMSLVGLDAQGIFDESDINLHLSNWLAGISDPTGSADYVTLRRALVDFGFLRRATDGLIYRIRVERIDETLTEDAKGVDPEQVFAMVAEERNSRRSSYHS